MEHPFISPNQCEWRGIIVRVLYIFTKLDIACPFIPDDLDVTLIPNFRLWASDDPGDYVGLPFHNGLKLFLWVITDFYTLFNKPV